MVIKKQIEADGIFQKTKISSCGKDAEKILSQAAKSNTSTYILGTLETNIKKYLKTAEANIEKYLKATKSRTRKTAIRESDERRRRDGERILQEIKFLRNIIHKENPDFVHAQFFYLGVHVQRADIRLVESDALRGIKTVLSAKEGGDAKATVSELRHSTWITDAEEIQEQRPTYSPWRIAGRLEIKYKDDPELAAKQDTIWRVIKSNCI